MREMGLSADSGLVADFIRRLGYEPTELRRLVVDFRAGHNVTVYTESVTADPDRLVSDLGWLLADKEPVA